MRSKLILSAALLMASSGAQAVDWGLGVKAGTVGYGMDLSFVLTETVNIRASYTQADFSESDTIDINDADNNASMNARMDLDFGSSAVLIDWYVFDGTFHLSAGLMKNDSSITFTGNLANATATIEGKTYNVATAFQNNGAMSGRIGFGNSYEPYLGIGWGRKADNDPGFSFSAEIGVVMMDPTVDLTAPRLVNAAGTTATDANNNPIAVTQAELDADVQAAEATAAQDLDDFELYPVISLGVNYAF